MQTEIFTVKNVKCGGCVSNIQTGLKEVEGVAEVDVVIDSGEVTVRGEHLARADLATKLSSLGYPEA